MKYELIARDIHAPLEDWHKQHILKEYAKYDEWIKETPQYEQHLTNEKIGFRRACMTFGYQIKEKKNVEVR
jgi:hypothetical protein